MQQQTLGTTETIYTSDGRLWVVVDVIREGDEVARYVVEEGESDERREFAAHQVHFALTWDEPITVA
jgi:predicted type IV restriction endonuclease